MYGEQTSIFGGSERYKITKPLRLIELFAGIGAQAKAIENLGKPFEHYRICEFDKYAVQSYNAIHGTNFKPSDITKIHADDLGITETDKYEYIATYSFPCTDLSVAGKQAGMTRGNGTRSGLLWEVERLLKECKELPQILLMENVPQVLNRDFGEWLDFLESKGYKNYYKILNAKNYGIPQNRDRCFMVSVLGDYYYEFPQAIPLELRLKDMLEEKVDEKYYLKAKQLDELKLNTENKDTVLYDLKQRKREGGAREYSEISPTLTSRDYKEPLRIKEPQCEQVAQLVIPGRFESACRVYGIDGIAPACNTCGGGGLETKIAEPIIYDDYNQRVKADQTAINTLTTNCGTTAERNGVKIIEPTMLTPKRTEYGKAIRKDYEAGIHKESRHNFTQLEPKQEPTSNTITTVQKDNILFEPIAYDEQNKCLRADGTVGTLTTDGSSPKHNNRVIENYRIRKLTPKECWRLMGFYDRDFDKAKASGVSDSQLYKQAGNSIVVPVLEAIINNLF